ncbi:hypothetical protein Maes01_01517 [Microbulbifer aestuariivivens]|uniref:N-acetyltransferase domain-containing protein n=2 Tax=Microbulbifer aestuariivivens TaxID=1908308 RepID=A0ABP9WP25_9GAMM
MEDENLGSRIMQVMPVVESQWELLRNIRLQSLIDSPDAFAITHEQAEKLTPAEWRFIASGAAGPRFLIARHDGQAVGLIGAVDSGGEYELVSLWVSPLVRGQGVGLELINSLRTLALEDGHRAVMLRVSSENTTAINLYLKAGFVPDFTEGGHCASGGGTLQKMVWHGDHQTRYLF